MTVTQKALDAFAQGRVDVAQGLLDEAATIQRDTHELLEIHCLRATLAAMTGRFDVVRLLAEVPQNESMRGPVQSYLEGIASMARGDLSSARRRLERAVELCEGFAAAMICLAAVRYLAGDYESSYQLYCDTLRMLGSKETPQVVRVGMGLCAFRLERPTDARRILERAVEVHPDDELAWLGLLVVYIDLRLLRQVHEAVLRLKTLMPHNKTVLLKVCDLMYFRALEDGRLQSAAPRIRSVLHFIRDSTSPEEMALADFQEGRLLFACGDVAAAQTLLEAAVRSSPNLLAARIHYARLLLHTNRVAEAETLLLEVNKTWANEKEVLQMLALIATRAGRHTEALRYSQLLTSSIAQGDLHSWSLAAVCARLDKDHCRTLCAHIRSIHRELNLPFSWRMTANLAVLSEDVVALQGIVDSEVGASFLFGSVGVAEEHVPLLYNLALLLEKTAAPRAKQLYVFLVKYHSCFKAAFYRLHFMAKEEGHLHQAAAWMQWLLKVHPKEAAAQSCLAQLYMERVGVKDALGIFEKVKASTSQLPIALAAGAASLQACQQSSSRWRVLLDTSKQLFLDALREDPRNILAAHGYACCDGIALQNDAAESMLNSVSEVMPLSQWPVKGVESHRANVKMLSYGYKQAMDYLSKMPARTIDQDSMLSFCLAKEGRYDEAIGLMLAAAKRQPIEDAMLIYNTSLLQFMAFLDGLILTRSLTEAQGSHLMGYLDAASLGSKQFEAMKSKNEIMSKARRYLRSINSYCERHRLTVQSLVEAGRERAKEMSISTASWRDVYATYVKEQQEREITEEVAKQQKLEEQKAMELAVQERFKESRIQRPGCLLDNDLLAANLAETGGDAMDALDIPLDTEE